jgi:mannose/fructose-specific phosphotransferase system component IIA
MSELPAVRGLVLAHGAFAEGIVDAVRQITGVGEEALGALSNRGFSPEALEERIRAWLPAGGPAILFTDLLAGSCGIGARRVCRERDQVVVVSGINLALLLDFVLHRDMPLDELVPRLLARGRAAVGCLPERYGEDAHRAVSGG